MQLYTVMRRRAWHSAEEMQATTARCARIADEELPEDVRWIRSYVLGEGDGVLGTVCVYEATTPEALREHAARVGMPTDEIVAVVGTVLVRPDPQPETS